MKIALLSLGTRGDVQPFAVLGKALQENGHQVTLSSAKNFEQLAHSYGLNFIPVEADFQELIASDAGRQMMKNPFRSGKFIKTLIHPMIYNSLNSFYEIAKENDKILFHVKTLADFFADQFPEKMIRTNVVPAFEPTNEFPNAIFSSLPSTSLTNKLSYHLTNLGLKMMMKPVRSFRQNVHLAVNYKKTAITIDLWYQQSFLEPTSRLSKKFTVYWILD